MKSVSVSHFALSCAIFVAIPCGLATAAIESHLVNFDKGASSATLSGSLKGNKVVDYKLRARAGQMMTVRLKTDNTANYFNVLPPGSQDVAVFIGSTSGNDWSGRLTADGEYTIRVYLMRSAARRNETARYTLTVGITGNASGALGTEPAAHVRVTARRTTPPARFRVRWATLPWAIPSASSV